VWAEEQAGPTLQVVGNGKSEVSTDDGCADGSCNI